MTAAFRRELEVPTQCCPSGPSEADVRGHRSSARMRRELEALPATGHHERRPTLMVDLSILREADG